jgi:hypothetical protein
VEVELSFHSVVVDVDALARVVEAQADGEVVGRGSGGDSKVGERGGVHGDVYPEMLEDGPRTTKPIVRMNAQQLPQRVFRRSPSVPDMVRDGGGEGGGAREGGGRVRVCDLGLMYLYLTWR